MAANYQIDFDAQLMLLAKLGDLNAFDQLIRKHRASVVRYAYRLVRDRTAAEDIAQEVFLRVYRGRAAYQISARFTTWLYRIAGNVALNWIRDHARARAHLPLETPGVEPLDSRFIDHAARIDQRLVFQSSLAPVRAAVDELPDRQRRVVLLHKFDDLECGEIASLLGCSTQAIRSTLCRAYTKLRRDLAAFAC